MKKVIYIALLAILLTSFRHPLHISVTNIEYNTDSNEFNIAFKIFKDDLSLISKQKENTRDTQPDSTLNEKKHLFKEYIPQNFGLVINHKKINNSDFMFVKTEQKEDAVWIYYKFKYKHRIKNVIIKNSILFDIYQDQENLVFFKYKDFETAIKCNIQTPSLDVMIQ